MTNGDIFYQFMQDTKIHSSRIEDWRPCEPLYGVPYISNAIVVWLKGGRKLIYIHESEVEE